MNYKRIVFALMCIYIPRIFCSEPAVGIQNQGNTCFMNAVLQCLYHTQELTNFLKSTVSDYYKPNSVATEYLEFIKMYQTALAANQKKISPIDWCKKIRSLEESPGTKRFPGTDTGDANEFLQVTLGHLGLDDTISDIKNKDKVLTRLPYPLQKLPQNSLTDSLASTMKGYDSSNKLNSIKSESSITLGIVEEFDNNDSAKKFYKNLDDALAYHFHDLTKIFKLPHYLPIAMAGFIPNYTTGQTIKIYQNIPFPLELNLADYLDENSPAQTSIYELYGVVLHHHDAFHYTAFVKIQDKWYDCDDSVVSDQYKDSSVEQEVKRLAASNEPHEDPTPYILFYKKKSPEIKIEYKNFDATSLIESALALIPKKLTAASSQLQEAISSNLETLKTVRKERIAAIRNDIEVYDISKKKIDNLVQNNNRDYNKNLASYLKRQKITLEQVSQSIKIGLIDENYLAAQVSVGMVDGIKAIVRQRLVEQEKLSRDIRSLIYLNNNLTSLNNQKQILAK